MQFDGEEVVIVGGIPEPIGGVTTYIYRLVRKESGRISAVVDLYPAREKKNISPVDHIRLKRKAALFFFLLKNRRDVYFNFSGVAGLCMLLLMPKTHGVRWYLTLHNGAIKEKLEGNCFYRIVASLARRRLDKVGFLSPSQRAAYKMIGIDDGRLVRVSSYVPICASDVKAIDRSKYPDLMSFSDNSKPYFVISGYPTKIYQHLEVFQTFERMWKDGVEVKLVACLYGDDSDGLLSSIKEKFSENGNALLYWGVDNDDFLSILSGASGYIRMNTVDSFGVAVAEAVSLGIPCIASDVCDRYPGAITVSCYDYSKVSDFVVNALGR